MKKIYSVFAVLFIIDIILVVTCGPNSCEWGNSVYFYFGIAGLLVSFIVPLIQKTWVLKKRIGFSVLFAVLSVIIWCAGFILGGFRITCHLI